MKEIFIVVQTETMNLISGSVKQQTLIMGVEFEGGNCGVLSQVV